MPSPETPPSTRPDPWLRAVLWCGVVVMVLSLLGLLGALAAYFLDMSWPFLPALYALSLFGLPLGFGLMVLHVLLAAVQRART